MINRGNKRGGRHLKQNIAKKIGNVQSENSSSPESKEPLSDEAKKKWSTKKKVCVILGSTAAVFAITVGIILLWIGGAREEAPDVRLGPTAPRASQIVLPQVTESDSASSESQNESSATPIDLGYRNTDKFTFLVLGLDPIGANTDVIMVGTFDVVSQTFHITNIPRDTIANVSWNLRKVNSIYANMRIRYRDEDNAELRAMEATVEAFRDILGFKVDFWVVVSHRALPALVDAIGGVDFNVPVNMYHSGVTLPRGQRRLTGTQALHLLRFRGFASADIGRINTAQNFLTAAAEQILARRDSIRVADLANVFVNNVVTDLSLSDLIWFGERFLQIDAESIHFHTMPGQLDNVRGGSFVSILLDEWLELLNTYINPFYSEITPETVSILTRGPDRRLFVTDGNWQGSSQWGAGTLGATNPNNIAEWAAPGGGRTTGGGTGGGTTGGATGGGGGGGGGAAAPQPEQPPPPTVCSICGSPPEECSLCFICGEHTCVCPEDTGGDDIGGGADDNASGNEDASGGSVVDDASGDDGATGDD